MHDTKTLRWCTSDSTLFPFDRALCFVSVVIERPQGDVPGATDRAKWSPRYPWASGSTLAYRNNFTRLLLELDTTPLHTRRYKRGSVVLEDVASVDREWYQSARGLYCHRLTEVSWGAAVGDIVCVTTVIVNRYDSVCCQ